MTAPLPELPEAVRAEIKKFNLVPREILEEFARLAMHEAAREFIYIVRTWGNTPMGRGSLICRVAARFGLEPAGGIAMTAPEIPEAVRVEYEVTEGIESYWHYHLSVRCAYTRSLCGRRTMQTSLPLSQFGKGKAAPPISRLSGHWCEQCQQLRTDHVL